MPDTPCPEECECPKCVLKACEQAASSVLPGRRNHEQFNDLTTELLLLVLANGWLGSKRQPLYLQEVASNLWSRISRFSSDPGITLIDLIRYGILCPGVKGLELFLPLKGRPQKGRAPHLKAVLHADGRLEFLGAYYQSLGSLTRAAYTYAGLRFTKPNGWLRWKYYGPYNRLRPLDLARAEYTKKVGDFDLSVKPDEPTHGTQEVMVPTKISQVNIYDYVCLAANKLPTSQRRTAHFFHGLRKGGRPPDTIPFLMTAILKCKNSTIPQYIWRTSESLAEILGVEPRLIRETFFRIQSDSLASAAEDTTRS